MHPHELGTGFLGGELELAQRIAQHGIVRSAIDASQYNDRSRDRVANIDDCDAAAHSLGASKRRARHGENEQRRRKNENSKRCGFRQGPPTGEGSPSRALDTL